MSEEDLESEVGVEIIFSNSDSYDAEYIQLVNASAAPKKTRKSILNDPELIKQLPKPKFLGNAKQYLRVVGVVHPGGQDDKHYNDKINDNEFPKAIKALTGLPVCFEHHKEKVLGYVRRVWIELNDLWCEIIIPLSNDRDETTRAIEQALLDKKLGGLSFAHVAERLAGKYITAVSGMRMVEVSVVKKGALPKSDIKTVEKFDHGIRVSCVQVNASAFESGMTLCEDAEALAKMSEAPAPTQVEAPTQAPETETKETKESKETEKQYVAIQTGDGVVLLTPEDAAHLAKNPGTRIQTRVRNVAMQQTDPPSQNAPAPVTNPVPVPEMQAPAPVTAPVTAPAPAAASAPMDMAAMIKQAIAEALAASQAQAQAQAQAPPAPVAAPAPVPAPVPAPAPVAAPAPTPVAAPVATNEDPFSEASLASLPPAVREIVLASKKQTEEQKQRAAEKAKEEAMERFKQKQAAHKETLEALEADMSNEETNRVLDRYGPQLHKAITAKSPEDVDLETEKVLEAAQPVLVSASIKAMKRQGEQSMNSALQDFQKENEEKMATLRREREQMQARSSYQGGERQSERERQGGAAPREIQGYLIQGAQVMPGIRSDSCDVDKTPLYTVSVINASADEMQYAKEGAEIDVSRVGGFQKPSTFESLKWREAQFHKRPYQSEEDYNKTYEGRKKINGLVNASRSSGRPITVEEAVARLNEEDAQKDGARCASFEERFDREGGYTMKRLRPEDKQAPYLTKAMIEVPTRIARTAPSANLAALANYPERMPGGKLYAIDKYWPGFIDATQSTNNPQAFSSEPMCDPKENPKFFARLQDAARRGYGKGVEYYKQPLPENQEPRQAYVPDEMQGWD